MDLLARYIPAIVNAVNEHGLCVIPSVLPESHAVELRSIIDGMREREPGPEGGRLGHQRVLHLAAKHSAFADLMCHPLTIAVCQEYLGSDFVCSTWTSNTALPGSDLTYWHVDHPYWTIAPPYPVDPPLTAHVIWCLDEFTEFNGATRFILGSHRRTQLPEHNGSYDSEGETVLAPAGSLVVAHGAIWHSAGKNSSDRPRTAVFGRFARSYIILQEDMRSQLSVILNPSSLIERLLGQNQYIPQSGLPY